MDDGNNNQTSSQAQQQQSSPSSSIFACYASSFNCGGGLEDSLDTNNDLLFTNTTSSSASRASSSQKQQKQKQKQKQQHNISNMRRASVSRRAEHLSSPRLRSRSQEGFRTEQDEEEDRMLDQLASEEFPMDHHFADSEHVDTSSRVRETPHGTRPDSVKSSSGSGGGGFHRRAMSDPFDAQELVEESAFLDSSAQIIAASKEGSLATLPRYPVSAQRNKNCWSEPPVSIFHVRGPLYFSDKKKVPSEKYLMPARGADLFLSETPVDYTQPSKSEIVLGGQLRKFPTVMINFQFPWGNLMLYYEVPAKLSQYLTETTVALDSSLTASETTLAAWLQGDEAYRNDRLKLIPYVAEGPWIVRSMVTGKPALIGKKLPVRYQLTPADAATGQAAVLECTLDIGSGSATAKRIVSVCRRYMSALTVDVGFVIQADTNAELPEQMLGSIRIHGVDPLQAPKLS